MPRTLAPRLAALLLPLALLPACAGLQDLARASLKRPVLHLRSASVQALDLEGATLAFTWDVENPNGFGVDLARVAWSIDVEGARLASGDLPGGLAVPANGVAPVSFPVRVRFADVPGIVALLGGGRDRIRYALAGNIGVRTPLGVIDLPLSHEDALRLPDLPRFAVEGITVRSASFTGVAVDVRLRVRNPNAFALPPGRLDYALAIGGVPVVRADQARIEPVAGGVSGIVAIPVRVDVASAGRAAAELARGAEVGVELTGRAHLGGIPLPLDLRAKVPARR